MIKYGIFQPFYGITYPPMPFKVDLLESDGSIVTLHVHDAKERQTLPWNYVAARFIEPAANEQLLVEFEKHTASSITGAARNTALALVDFVLQRQPKVDSQPLDPRQVYLERKLNELDLNRTERALVSRWFNEPDAMKYVTCLTGNPILTSKQVPGGRVVVLPSGHTIAYSKAQQIWNCMKYSDGRWYHNSKVTVGECGRGGVIRHTDRYKLNVTRHMATIGCQTVRFNVIDEFARMEGWTESDGL